MSFFRRALNLGKGMLSTSSEDHAEEKAAALAEELARTPALAPARPSTVATPKAAAPTDKTKDDHPWENPLERPPARRSL